MKLRLAQSLRAGKYTGLISDLLWYVGLKCSVINDQISAPFEEN